ncbi:response regulator [Aromatoleum aromaticum]|uniref:Nitrate/nitrite response regulator n=1 Tax=Aromatoleum aromaticum (strain DSM 19018 / LMG 30748 / EbN1) TaxID=76114 RepID=Q5NYZ9_AROAE|nr:response regulator transcription factor [Aromatoleum aromaticum]NMG55639.1 response regulator [Aromatoleum aromaticum]CAI09715.1 Nitrate/nitrite response regulator [Aromatoleum aromaticum EbN1]
MPDPIRVLLVDDHALFRSGIKSLLQRHAEFEIVGEAGDGMEGVKRAGQLKPDVVLLDLHMPGLSGRDAAAMMAEEAPNSHVLMLTVSEDAEDLIETLRAGACGYLLKNIEADALIAAINRAAEGESVISPQMMGKLLKGVRGELPVKTAAQTAVASELNKLSPREREILAFLARGQSNKEIARKLELAESTVKIHVQNVLRKLNLTSRVQAAVFAVEQGIVQDSEA